MISVIIPTLNEAHRLPALLERLKEERTPHELIIVDGGSCDGTADVARRWTRNVVVSSPGRGAQLRSGATAAIGDIVLFLHADSIFPRGGLQRLEQALAAAPQAIGGNFRLVFDGTDEFSMWLTRFYARLRRRGIYYGDSGVFVRRAVYEAVGGIRPIALMEDYDFVRRMERSGETCCVENPPLLTSSRRFAGRRPVSIVVGWIFIHALFHLGISPDVLARLYDSRRLYRPG